MLGIFLLFFYYVLNLRFTAFVEAREASFHSTFIKDKRMCCIIELLDSYVNRLKQLKKKPHPKAIFSLKFRIMSEIRPLKQQYYSPGLHSDIKT